MVGNKPHRLDKDVRRVRLHFLPNYTCGEVALFSRAPYDSISLRDCTAKCEGFFFFVIRWQSSVKDLKSMGKEGLWSAIIQDYIDPGTSLSVSG